MSDTRRRSMLGHIAIFASAFFIYLSAVAIRWSESYVEIHPSFFLFSRYLLGFLTVAAVLLVERRRPEPRRLPLIMGRTITNVLAVFFLYKAVTVTTVAEANILNMTHPLFIALLSWIFFKNQRDLVTIVFVMVAWVGVFLILAPGKMEINLNNLWGLASGFSAAFAIMLLRQARQHDDSETILYYMFGIGTLIIFILFPDKIHIPNKTEFYYLFLCAGFGVAAQFLLTYGFRYVTAVEGSIISSTRILMAALLGPVIAYEEMLGIYGWIGTILIFTANAFLAVRKAAY